MSEQPTKPQQEVNDSKQKIEAKRKKEYEANKKALEELCELYPEVFDLRNPKPLQIGIHNAIAEDGKLSKTRIRRALNLYVRMRRYIACLKEDAVRVTLGGETAGKVTAEEAIHAIEKLSEIDKKRAQRKPASDKPRAKRKPARKPGQKNTKPAGKPAAKKTETASKPQEPQANAEERFQAKLAALVNKKSN